MYYAEHGTDLYIRETFFPNINENKTMIEVGAGPTDFYSMSKHFRNNGWRCIGVDPNPNFVEQHKKLNNEIYQYACADFEGKTIFKIVETGRDHNSEGVSYSALDIKYPMEKEFNIIEIPVEVIKLDTLLEKIDVHEIDFVSIDTEGWELEVMKGFNTEKYQPWIVLLENLYHDETYTEYMENINYELIKKIEYNYIFKRK